MPRTLPIRTRLLGVFLGGALVVTAAGAVVLLRQNRQVIQRETRSTIGRELDVLAGRVRGILTEKQWVVERLAQASLTRLYLDHPGYESKDYALLAHDLKLITAHDSLVSLVYVQSARDYTQLCQSDLLRLSPGYNPAGSPWWDLPVATGRFQFTPPYIEKPGESVAQSGLLMVSANAPVYDANQVLAGVVGLDLILQRYHEFFTTARLPPGGYAFLLTADDRILYHPRGLESLNRPLRELDGGSWAETAARIAAHPDSPFRLVDPMTDQPVWIQVQTVPPTGWKVGVVFPEDELLANLHYMQRWSYWYVALGLAFALWLAVHFSGVISRPLRSLAQATGAMADGQFREVPLAGDSNLEEVAVLAESFNTMVAAIRRRSEQLEAKNAELEQFAYTVSHDLKSPLVTILGFAGLIRQDIEDGESARVAEHVARIARAGRRMEDLLSDLLRLSRIGRVVEPTQIVSFTDLAREAIDQLSGEIARRGVRITVVEPLPQVRVDHTRMVEALVNLLSNAIHYSAGASAQPVIEIGRRLDGGESVLYVRDNGIGIAPEHHERIFGLFQRLHEDGEGTGVGLAIVRRIIAWHGGRIWVESELGHGATFCFTLGRL